MFCRPTATADTMKARRLVDAPLLGTPGLDSPVAAAPSRKVKNAVLGEGTAVLNCRDLADGTAGAIARGRVFRSGALTLANGDDVMKILDELRVRTFLDLRSEAEVARDDVAAPLTTKLAAVSARVVRLPLIDERKVAPVLFGLMPLRVQARLICCFPCLGRVGATRLFAVHGLGQLGLLGLYVILVDSSQDRLLAALEAVLAALEGTDSAPLLFHCSAGKDRTGVLAALILSACGVHREEIVEQYLHSEHWHAELSDGIAALTKDSGAADGAQGDMAPHAFLRAPAATMEALLDHIDDRYGSAQAYMVQIGFGVDKQMRLRAALAPELTV